VNLDDFSACIEKESSFRPFGELLHSFCKSIPKAKPAKAEQNGFGATNGNDSEESTFEIYTCSSATPKFGTYLKRMEAFVLWFIDAASFIDPDDEKWIFFVM
jgi:histone acetyltransferase 1